MKTNTCKRCNEEFTPNRRAKNVCERCQREKDSTKRKRRDARKAKQFMQED